MDLLRETRMSAADSLPGPHPVCLLGHHELDYPRNLALRAALEDAGREVFVCHSQAPFPLRHLVLASQLLRIPRSVKVVIVTEGGHRLVPWVRAVARTTGRRVVFDPFTSRYNTRVEDRKWFKPGSVQARIAHFQDWSSTHAADYLLFDTEEHREYFYERYKLSKPSAIVPVGVQEDLFFPRPGSTAPGSQCQVLFYGTYIPLQGVETIVEAAASVPLDANIRFTLIGEGQTRSAIEQRAKQLKLTSPRVRFEGSVPCSTLPQRLTDADIVLGIFGTTTKATRVVPNKVVQAAAMGCAIITADTPAVRRYFRHEHAAYLVPAGDADALARAVVTLKENAGLRRRLARGARDAFEKHFSRSVVRRTLARAIEQLETT